VTRASTRLAVGKNFFEHHRKWKVYVRSLRKNLHGTALLKKTIRSSDTALHRFNGKKKDQLEELNVNGSNEKQSEKKPSFFSSGRRP